MVRTLIQQVIRWDDRVLMRLGGNGSRKIGKCFFYFLSRSAESYSCTLAGLLGVLISPKTLPYVFAGVMAFMVELTLYYLVKKNVCRPRPFKKIKGVHYLILPPDEFSFPSGHTGAAFLMATLIALAVPVLTLPIFLWAILVGISRVYLGVHYPTDVLAGMVLGLLSAQVGLWIASLCV